MTAGIDRRRTIRIRRSQLLQCKLADLDRPAIKIIEDLNEYCKVFRLVYGEYSASGYTSAHPSKMYYNVWSMLPTTTIFAFKSFLNVVSTVSVINDTELFGLPIDAVFKEEVDALRRQGRKVAEIGALANLRMRRWSNVIVLLFKAIFYYTALTKINDLVIMVNPKHQGFYTQILLFEPLGNGEAKEYEKVGAPAVPLRLNMDKYVDRLAEMYANSDFETDLHAFFTNLSDPMLMSVGNTATGTRKVLDPYSAYFFFKNRLEILKSLTEEQHDYLINLYHQSIFPLDTRRNETGPMDEAVRPVLELMHLENKEDYSNTAFSRNLGLIDYTGQQKLLKTRVAIPGLGGVGGVHLSTLARTGIGAFNLADFDTYSPVNINRQYGSDLTTFTHSKLKTMRDKALAINPFLDIRCFWEGVTKKNLDTFLEKVDIVLDSLDFFTQDIRRALFNRALEKNIPVITAAPAGYSCSILVFMPDGMNYDKYFGVNDETDPIERLIRFTIGVAPRPTHIHYMDRRFVNIYDRRVPSLDIGCQLCAGMAATEVVNIVTRGKPSIAVPGSMQFDAKRGILRKNRLFWGVNSPLQRAKVKLAKKLFLYPSQKSPTAQTKPGIIQECSYVTENALRFIARAGIQAPSGDNAQPWKFSFEPGGLTLYINRQADDSFFNVNQAASLIAGGAALENIKYAAGALGLESKISLLPDGEGTDRLATVHFSPTGVAFDELMEDALWRRSTNRRMYSRKQLSPEVWKYIGRLANMDENILLIHNYEQKELSQLAKAVFFADRVRVERKDLHEYLMRILHFDHLPANMDEKHCPEHLRTGMPLKNLQAGPLGEMYLRAIRPWNRMRIANMLGLGLVMPLYSWLSVHLSGGVGLICADSFAERSLIQAGRAVQRIWCTLDHLGFSMQPLAAIPLLTLRQRMNGDAEFSPRHVRLLNKSWKITEKVLAVPPEYVPVFMFRAGLSRPINQRTFRQKLASVMLKESV